MNSPNINYFLQALSTNMFTFDINPNIHLKIIDTILVCVSYREKLKNKADSLKNE